MAHQSGYLSFIDASDLVTLRAGLVDYDLTWEVRQLPTPRFGLTYKRHIHDVGGWLFQANFNLPTGVASTDIDAGAVKVLEVFANATDKWFLDGNTELWRASSPIDGVVVIAMAFRGDNLITWKGGHLIPPTL